MSWVVEERVIEALAMNTIANETVRVTASRRQLWFGLLGGALAWLIHFFAAYLLAEFGCVSGWGKKQWMGISAVAWLVLAMTLFMTLVGLAAAWSAWRAYLRLRTGPSAEVALRGELYLAQAGALTSSIFVAAILFETIPVFFYLQRC
jgi:hypothetical protein